MSAAQVGSAPAGAPAATHASMPDSWSTLSFSCGGMGRAVSCTRVPTNWNTFLLGSLTAGATRSACVLSDIGAPAAFCSLWHAVQRESSVRLTPHHCAEASAGLVVDVPSLFGVTTGGAAGG